MIPPGADRKKIARGAETKARDIPETAKKMCQKEARANTRIKHINGDPCPFDLLSRVHTRRDRIPISSLFLTRRETLSARHTHTHTRQRRQKTLLNMEIKACNCGVLSTSYIASAASSTRNLMFRWTVSCKPVPAVHFVHF